MPQSGCSFSAKEAIAPLLPPQRYPIERCHFHCGREAGERSTSSARRCGYDSGPPAYRPPGTAADTPTELVSVADTDPSAEASPLKVNGMVKVNRLPF